MEAAITKQIVDWASLGVGTGVFCLLCYVIAVIGPRLAKDAAVKDKERDKASREERKDDREARHDAINAFQKCIFEMHMQHEKDAKADREAFERRNERLEDALKIQTAELKLAITTATCRFYPPQVPQRESPSTEGA